jgi:CRISPR-associated protein (TIGR02584 family)
MMATIYLATLGQRPEAITIALDLLIERYVFKEAVILHTDPRRSGIREAYLTLNHVLDKDYPALPARWHELADTNGVPLIDIVDQSTATAYYRAIYKVLSDYKRQRHTLQLMVAGGRKAMSIYATLAASLIFDERDFVWTVLSPPSMVEKPNVFHIPAGMRDQVQVVPLPLLPTRLLLESIPTDAITDPMIIVSQRANLRETFLEKLTPAERELAIFVAQNQHLTARGIAAYQNKSRRTVQNQLSVIYGKMTSFLDMGEAIEKKHQALIALVGEHRIPFGNP